MAITIDRTKIVEDNFLDRVKNNNLPSPPSQTSIIDTTLTKEETIKIFYSQIESRILDIAARKLKQDNLGYYTIGSSGHEGCAAIADALTTKNMAFLHYRDSAFMLHRSRKEKGESDIIAHARALVASKNDPISSGRHKVLGSKELKVPPQTSTIASHTPRALGCAYSIAFSRKLGLDPKIDYAVCSFGDGSFNHSTLQGSLNSSSWLGEQGMPVPLLFICEDNGIAISVPTPNNWIASSMHKRYGWDYIPCDGLNIFDTFLAAKRAQERIIKSKKPVFLHMKTVRLFGHAGSDVEQHYKPESEIKLTEERDPLLMTAGLLIKNGVLTSSEILDIYKATKANIDACVKEALKEGKLDNKKEVMQSIIPFQYPKRSLNKYDFNVSDKKLTIAQSINKVLDESLSRCPHMVVFGEDVGKKGGVYRVTAGLQEKFGRHRVFDSLLDEQTILGSALGMSLNGILPVCEIQFLAYIYNALDQLRGEAATQSFFSNSQFTNPMIIRLPGLAYQKGFGGHFHNDNGFAPLCDIPGVIVACPATPQDAVTMFRECLSLAYVEHRVIVWLEPIALYHAKDLYVPGDKMFLMEYPGEDVISKYNEVSCERGKDINIISYGNGFVLSMQAKKRLQDQYGIYCNIINLRWLSPLPIDSMVSKMLSNIPTLIVDEGRNSKSISETIISQLVDRKINVSECHRITGEDSFVPLGEAWRHIVPGVEDIVNKVLHILQKVHDR